MLLSVWGPGGRYSGGDGCGNAGFEVLPKLARDGGVRAACALPWQQLALRIVLQPHTTAMSDLPSTTFKTRG